MTGFSWETIQRVTQGRFGRTMATCPLCSADRHSPQKRASKVLAVNLVEPEFAIYFCNHCGESGYSHPDAPRRVVDLAEQQRRRDEARRHAETEKQKRKDQARPDRIRLKRVLMLDLRRGQWPPLLRPRIILTVRYLFGVERVHCQLAPIRHYKRYLERVSLSGLRTIDQGHIDAAVSRVQAQQDRSVPVVIQKHFLRSNVALQALRPELGHDGVKFRQL
jgi:hypothetical protein